MRDDVHTRVQHVSLLERGSQCPMQTVLEVELAAPIHDMGKQVTEEGGVRVEERRQVESVFRRDELIEPDLVRRQLRPIGHGEAMLGVRTVIAHALEDHQSSLGPAPTRSCPAAPCGHPDRLPHMDDLTKTTFCSHQVTLRDIL